MAALANQNNEDVFLDAIEEIKEIQEIQEIKKTNQLKIIKKKTTLHEHQEPKKITIKDAEYLEYKTRLFGKLEPDRTDKYCDFYLCNHTDYIKYFAKNIKEYALNTDISTEHSSNISKNIYKTKKLYFVNPIALVEYTDITATTPKDLIEIVDGHHRLKCLQKMFSEDKYEDIDFTFWIQIYRCTTQKDADELFMKYNTCKPFAVNIKLLDLITLIIDKLNSQFETHKFEFIKDTKQRTNRPSVCKKEFTEKTKTRLEIQMQTIDTLDNDYKDINIDKIITKFKTYNDSLSDKSLEWFNKKCITSKIATITDKMYKKAKENGCVLGLLPLDELISNCVCL
jgi:hypothetical protein